MTSPGRARMGTSAHDTVPPIFVCLEAIEMDVMQAVTQLISNVGFPIACVIAMFYMWDKERTEHKTESERWVEALNNNTNVIQKLIDKMGG